MTSYIIRSQGFFYTDEYYAPTGGLRQVHRRRYRSRAGAEAMCAALARMWVRSEPLADFVFDRDEGEQVGQYLHATWPEQFPSPTFHHRAELPSDATDAQVDAVIALMGITFAQVFEVDDDPDTDDDGDQLSADDDDDDGISPIEDDDDDDGDRDDDDGDDDDDLPLDDLNYGPFADDDA